MNINPIININSISHTYIKEVKEPGLIGSIKGLFKPRTEEINALTDISFSINEGEVVGLIGHNGAGKTTLIKILTGLMMPTKGSVNVLGYNPFKRTHDYLRKIALISGNRAQLWWDMCAIDSFELIRVIYDIDTLDYKRNLYELVELLNVEEVLNTPLRKVSLGERMKLELIGALLHSPQVLFLDEPTIGLDIVSRRSIERFLLSYNENKKCTIIFTSHYIEEIDRICDRIIWLNKGVKVFDDSKSKLSALDNQKIVNVKVNNFNGNINWQSYGNVITDTLYSASISCDSLEIPRLTEKLFKELNVIDISIQEKPLSDIVYQLFLDSKKVV